MFIVLLCVTISIAVSADIKSLTKVCDIKNTLKTVGAAPQGPEIVRKMYRKLAFNQWQMALYE